MPTGTQRGFQYRCRVKMDAYGHSKRFSVPMEGKNGSPRALREVFSAGGGRKWRPTGTQRGFQCRWRAKMEAYGHSERFSVPVEGENGCLRALREVFSAGGG